MLRIDTNWDGPVAVNFKTGGRLTEITDPAIVKYVCASMALFETSGILTPISNWISKLGVTDAPNMLSIETQLQAHDKADCDIGFVFGCRNNVDVLSIPVVKLQVNGSVGYTEVWHTVGDEDLADGLATVVRLLARMS